MALAHWRGDAPAQARVVRITPLDAAPGDRFTLTVNGKTAVHPAASTSAAEAAAGLAAAWAAAPWPEFAEAEAAAEGGVLTLTAVTPGAPFDVVAGALAGGGSNTPALLLEELVPSRGPAHWDTPANWSTGAAPQTGDEVWLEDSAGPILYGLNQPGVLLAALRVAASFTGRLGLPRVNRAGAAPYVEYRPRALAIGAALVTIGHGDGAGPGSAQLDTLSYPTRLEVWRTALAGETPALLWKGQHPDNTLWMSAGDVGLAWAGGDAATLAELRLAGGRARCGAGLTLALAEVGGDARLELAASVGALRQTGGETTLRGAAGVSQLTLGGGRVVAQSSGDLGAIEIDGADALLDCSSDVRPRAAASCALRRGAIHDPHGAITWTTGVQPRGSLRAEG